MYWPSVTVTTTDITKEPFLPRINVWKFTISREKKIPFPNRTQTICRNNCPKFYIDRSCSWLFRMPQGVFSVTILKNMNTFMDQKLWRMVLCILQRIILNRVLIVLLKELLLLILLIIILTSSPGEWLRKFHFYKNTFLL